MPKIQACVVTCMDFRFQRYILDYLETNGFMGDADIISVAGASHDISVPESRENGEFLIKQIGVSVSFHHPGRIIIIDHQDCGMYATTDRIPHGLSFSEDLAKHTPYLLASKRIIQEVFGQIEVDLLYLGLDGSITKL